MPTVPKQTDKIKLRMDLDPETSVKFERIQKWMGSQSRTEVVRFCIQQVFSALERNDYRSLLSAFGED